MSDETPWSHLQQVFASGASFDTALAGLAVHGINGDDMVVLLGQPDSDVVRWMKDGSSERLTLRPADPPEGAALPARRSGSRGFFGWLSGATAIEGVGLFTDAEVFDDRGVHFAVLPETLRGVAWGEQVRVRIIALNCTSIPRSLEVSLEAERGVVQGPRHYSLDLDPGVVCLAVLPVFLCPLTPAVVRVVPVFEASEPAASRRVGFFSARPYARPMSDALALLIGVTAVAAVAGLSPVLVTRGGAADQGSPDPLRFRPELSAPIVAGAAHAVLWKLASVT